jgi:hypothetical protein
VIEAETYRQAERRKEFVLLIHKEKSLRRVYKKDWTAEEGG